MQNSQKRPIKFVQIRGISILSHAGLIRFTDKNLSPFNHRINPARRVERGLHDADLVHAIAGEKHKMTMFQIQTIELLFQ